MALIIKFPGRPFNWSDAQHRAAGKQLPFAAIKNRADAQRFLNPPINFHGLRHTYASRRP